MRFDRIRLKTRVFFPELTRYTNLPVEKKSQKSYERHWKKKTAKSLARGAHAPWRFGMEGKWDQNDGDSDVERHVAVQVFPSSLNHSSPEILIWRKRLPRIKRLWSKKSTKESVPSQQLVELKQAGSRSRLEVLTHGAIAYLVRDLSWRCSITFGFRWLWGDPTQKWKMYGSLKGSGVKSRSQSDGLGRKTQMMERAPSYSFAVGRRKA